MSQFDFGNLESPLDGESFINDNLEPWRDALLSCHSGGSTPSYAMPGTLWIKNDVSPWVAYVFDGSDNIKVGTINATTNVFTPEGAVLSIVAGTDIVVDSTDPKNPIVRFNGATFTLEDDSVTNAKLANMNANTVKVNATTGSANPTDLALAVNTLLGRGNTGNNISAVAIGDGLTMDGSTLKASSVRGKQVFKSSGTFNVPAGVTKVWVSGVGGGGGGGNISRGGGSSGAGAFHVEITVTPGEAVSVTIGAGGVGATIQFGIDGGTTSFGSYVSFLGGKGNNSSNLGGAPVGTGSCAGGQGNIVSGMPGDGGASIFGGGGLPNSGVGVFGGGGGGGVSAGGAGGDGLLIVEW